MGQVIERRRPLVPPGLVECDGPMDRHHLVRQNRIKQEIRNIDQRGRALGDDRGMVDTCRKHHEHVENRRVVIWREDLPPAVHEFASDYGLAGWLDRYFPPAPKEAENV